MTLYRTVLCTLPVGIRDFLRAFTNTSHPKRPAADGSPDAPPPPQPRRPPPGFLPYLFSRHGKRSVKPLLERAAALEDGRQEEIEQGPQLRELVLQRGSRQQQTARSHVVRVEDLGELAVVVLHSVALVHDHVLPADLREGEGRCGQGTVAPSTAATTGESHRHPSGGVQEGSKLAGIVETRSNFS